MRERRAPVVAGHRFALGHTVRLSRSLILPNVPDGEFTIVALLPSRDGVFQYRVKSTLEPYQRVVKEDQLAG